MMTWKVEEIPGQGRTIVLSGTISEEADFLPITALDGAAPLRLDLAEVNQINSCGVREWIHFVRQVSGAARPLEFVRCSPAIVRQLNTISNFRGAGAVRSVLLPYYCATCEHEQVRLLVLPETGAPAPIEDRTPCEKCGAACEFDDIASHYLAFATETRLPVRPTA